MNPSQLAAEFLHDAPKTYAIWMRDWLIEELPSFDRAVLARCDDDSLAILAIREGTMNVFRRHGEALDMADWGELRGAGLTTHRNAVDGSLPLTGYTLWHPVFPRGGTLRIDIGDLDDEDREQLPGELERFLDPRRAEGAWVPTGPLP